MFVLDGERPFFLRHHRWIVVQIVYGDDNLGVRVTFKMSNWFSLYSTNLNSSLCIMWLRIQHFTQTSFNDQRISSCRKVILLWKFPFWIRKLFWAIFRFHMSQISTELLKSICISTKLGSNSYCSRTLTSISHMYRFSRSNSSGLTTVIFPVNTSISNASIGFLTEK